MSEQEARDGLSSAARYQLEDYLSEYREQIVAEAERLNPDDIVTLRDIRDAFERVNRGERESLGGAGVFLGVRALRTPRAIGFPLVGGLLSLVTAAILLTLTMPSPVSSINGGAPILIAAMAAYVSAVVSLSSVFLAWNRSRRERSRAVRYAELGGRSADDAEYLATVMLSSGSSKDDDRVSNTERFIARWARLEDRLRSTAVTVLDLPADAAEDYPIGPLLESLRRVGVLDLRSNEEFKQILDVRNRLAHGGWASPAETQVGLDYMEVLEKILDERDSASATGERRPPRSD